jgi:FlaA1/EpsC-like NDP-sugar epimerase/lipopolysaccharide/colanic/teichoic acid biosynthesis glycosyltransferase
MNETFYSRVGKRWFDCACAVVGIVVTSPILLLAALAVRLTGAGPVFFRQTRAGRFGRLFRIIKFRTMKWNDFDRGSPLTASGDARVTLVGRFLRRTKIDEFPQLFNIVRGDMSFVGPRPEIPMFVRAYTETERRVLVAKPGVTGPAAIAYVHEEQILAGSEDKESFYRSTILPAKLEMDLEYCSNIRFLRDLQLMMATVVHLFSFRTAAGNPGANRAVRQRSDNRTRGNRPWVKRMIPTFNFYSRGMQFVVDALIFTSALLIAYVVRFESWPSGSNLRQLLFWLPVLVVLRLAIYFWRDTYRLIWRFVSLPDAVEIAKSIAMVTAILVAARTLLPGGSVTRDLLRLPFSVIILEGLLSLIGCLGARALRRVLYSHQRRVDAPGARAATKRTILYGAGRAGQLLRRELENNLSVDVVGFVDDDPQKIGRIISRTRVLGTGENLVQLTKALVIDEVVISMATASRETLLRVTAKCRETRIPVKIIPSVQEILSGRTRISELRETRPEDLLGRQSVEVAGFQEAAESIYRGKRVLVTGAGGSIGRELVRQIVPLGPAAVTILDKDENSIYELEQELGLNSSSVPVYPQVADVRHEARLRAIFSSFRPQVVFHAAAHKHVPLMELQPSEAILNNVCGTINVLKVSRAVGVERFVFISSDKAVNPANVMGATKRIGELLVQTVLGGNSIRSASVRFGNVLGSRGSVLPLFQKQIAAGGPVTITHPGVVRYFMTISEAVHLILCAGTLANGGGIFLLDMGEPRNILQLANEMITLSGLEPGRDIATTITGLRPGEKLFEELSSSSETLRRTKFDKLSLINAQPLDEQFFHEQIARLIGAADNDDSAGIYEILHHLEMGYRPVKPLKQAAAAG